MCSFLWSHIYFLLFTVPKILGAYLPLWISTCLPSYVEREGHIKFKYSEEEMWKCCNGTHCVLNLSKREQVIIIMENPSGFKALTFSIPRVFILTSQFTASSAYHCVLATQLTIILFLTWSVNLWWSVALNMPCCALILIQQFS